MRLILYHDMCLDGFCSAWLLHQVYPDAEFKAVAYAGEVPDVTGKDVIIVDFSYKRDVLEKMKQQAASLQVYDHHKTAEEDLRGLDYCIFDMNKSGCMLAWIYELAAKLTISDCARETLAPWMVRYIQDYDLWKWQLPHSKEINAAIASYERSFEVWDELKLKDIKDLITEGTAILRYQQQLIHLIIKDAYEVEIMKHKVPCVNSPILQSEIGAKLAQGKPFSVVWFEQDKCQKYSLRSAPNGIDVSEIAKHCGGGGHTAAAGFIVKTKKWSID